VVDNVIQIKVVYVQSKLFKLYLGNFNVISSKVLLIKALVEADPSRGWRDIETHDRNVLFARLDCLVHTTENLHARDINVWIGWQVGPFHMTGM
jgi:hypothetical protein